MKGLKEKVVGLKEANRCAEDRNLRLAQLKDEKDMIKDQLKIKDMAISKLKGRL